MVSRKGDGRMRNVILIGMPGCGKSTVGVLAAKALTMDFVDTDLLLQRKAGRPLQRMVDELGAEGFARVEEACVCGLEARGAVIATGGSVATEDAAMEHLKAGGLVIFPAPDAGDAFAPPQEHENPRHRHGKGPDAAGPL